MRAMVFQAVGQPLALIDLPIPEPGRGEVLLRVLACGICRTDLHLMDGEVTVPAPPRVLGHQIIATRVADGRRVGVPWLGFTCGTCQF
jgi:propanol-preferring alcohol dehydrogenase